MSGICQPVSTPFLKYIFARHAKTTHLHQERAYTYSGISCPECVHQFFCCLLMHNMHFVCKLQLVLNADTKVVHNNYSRGILLTVITKSNRCQFICPSIYQQITHLGKALQLVSLSRPWFLYYHVLLRQTILIFDSEYRKNLLGSIFLNCHALHMDLL